ncbi:MAG: hypothetical protein QXV69_08180 [Sulfolobaceae archaeon]
MQLPKNSSDLIKSIKITEVQIPLDISFILYSREGILPAYTLYRVLPLINSNTVHIIELYEGLFSLLPYLEVKGNIFLFSNDLNEIKEFIDTNWALEQSSIIFSCSEIKGIKGKVIVNSFNEPLCEINISLSILFSLARSSQNPRLIRLREEISNLSDLEEWIISKLNNFSISNNTEIVLSPIFKPAEIFIDSIIGLKVSSLDREPKQDELIIVYTTAESTLVRRYEMRALKRGKKFKEFLLDVDPILAPVYLIILISYAKLAGGFNWTS